MSYRCRQRLVRPAGQMVLAAVVGLLATGGLSACSEKLESSAACPIGCSGETAEIQNVVLDDAVIVDTTVSGSLGLGTQTFMLLANRGDTVDTRVIIRFDSLPNRIQQTAGDSTTIPITTTDSTYLQVRLDSSAARLGDVSSISVYDVGGAANDTAVADLAAQFVPANLIAVRDVGFNALADTINIRLPNNVVAQHIIAGTPLRVGLRVSSARSVSTRVYATESGFGPVLSYRANPDTTIAPKFVGPRSKTPANLEFARSLADFPIIVAGPPPGPAGMLVVGGLPSTRTYLRLNIPPRYLDSAIVVRATLLLTQASNTTPDGMDTMRVTPLLGVGSPLVTDPRQAARLTSFVIAPMDTIRTLTNETHAVEIQIAPSFRVWAVQGDSLLPRAIILQSSREDSSPQQLLFYSSEAADPALRPKLRISYTLRTRIGIP